MGPAICATLALILAGAWIAPARAAATPEYQLKAVFLFNFTQFVEWPAAQAGEQPFVIGVLGEDPFREVLDDTLRGEMADGRSLVVQRYRTVADIGNCQILFIAQSQAADLEAVLAQLRDRPILTVSDVSDFAVRGGAIQFVTVDNKLKLRINAQTAAIANLSISSKLLRLADIVATRAEPQRK